MNRKLTFSVAVLSAAFLAPSWYCLAEGAEATPPMSIAAGASGGELSGASDKVVLAAVPPLGPEVGVKFTEDFSNPENILNINKWFHSNQPFETGRTDIEVGAGGGLLTAQGQATRDYWGGRSIHTVDAFSVGPTSLKVTVERPYLNLVSGVSVRSAVFLCNSDRSRYFLFSDNRTENGWSWNADTTGAGTAVSAFSPMNDGLDHTITLVYDGAAVEMFLDGVYGGSADWVCDEALHVELGFYARETGAALEGAFGPLTIENIDASGNIVRPGDIAMPIHATGNMLYSNSSYPAAENPAMALDQDTSTKYLNFGGTKSGFIVTPAAGKTTVKSLKMWTANDAEERDPAHYELYGTDDAIVSTDNSFGDGENWTLIQAGSVALPAERLAEGPLATVANETAYTSYKLIFNGLKGNALMQVADVQFYSDAEGKTGLLGSTDSIIAVSHGVAAHMSYYESTQHLIDNNANTKYFNGLGANSGVIFLPSNRSSVVKEMILTTANDSPERDPMTFALYGTNEEVQSTDFSHGDAEDWTLITEGTTGLPEDRLTTATPIVIGNNNAYSAYKILFPTVRGEGATFQLADVQLVGQLLETPPASLINTGDEIVISGGSAPDAEIPTFALDRNLATKYLNREAGTGFIVTPKGGAVLANYFMYTTANGDNTSNIRQERDPVAFAVYGTNDALDAEEVTWAEAGTGNLEPGDFRLRNTKPVFFANGAAYKSYKVLFTGVRGGGMYQVSEVFMFGHVDAPVIKGFEAQDGTEGEALTFVAKVEGTEPLAYQWYKNGTAIEGATGSTYAIAKASLADIGSYSFTVGNSEGTLTSTTEAVKVYSSPANTKLQSDFHFDEAEGDESLDFESGLYGSLTSDTAPTWSDSAPSREVPTKYSEYDYSLVFTPTSGFVFSAEMIDISGDNRSMTVEFWFKNVSASADEQSLVALFGNVAGTCPNFELCSHKGILFLETSTDEIDTGVVLTNDGKWHHMLVAYNDPAELAIVAVDGKEMASGAFKLDANEVTTTDWSASIGYHADAQLDRVRIWKGMAAPELLDYPVTDPIPPYYYDDVNYTGTAGGSVTYDEATDTFTVKGSGADVWGTSDQFFYVYNPTDGNDFDVSVKVENFDGASNSWAKAGLMVREGDADGNLTGGGRYFDVQVLFANGASDSRYMSVWRSATDADVNDSCRGVGANFIYPHWQRIICANDVFYGFISEDGTNWTLLGTQDTTEWSEGALGSSKPLYVGAWVTSHNADSNDATATFSGMQFSSGTVPLQIVNQPVSLETVIGANASLNALVIGSGDIDYQWFKNGEAVEGPFDSSFFCVASAWDAGEYQLKVTQGDQTILSDVVTLKVNESPSPDSALAFVYSDPNPGSLTAVMEAFDSFRNPDLVLYLNEYLETPTDRADYYGSAINGFIIPEETGTFYFYIASDDDSKLFLSTDSDPRNLSAEPIAYVSGWAPSRKYDQEPNQKSAAINLVGGEKYYFQAFHNEGAGGDNLSVAWATPSMGDVLPTVPIEAKYVAPFFGITPMVVNVETPAVVDGNSTTLKVVAVGPGEKFYQWYKNGVAIDGATNSEYKIDAATLADAGSYTVGVSNVGGTTMSDAKVLEVSSNPANLKELLNFHMDEGVLNETYSDEGDAVATLGFEADPNAHVNGVNAPSGLLGDYAVSFNGKSWLLGYAEKPLDLTQPFTWEAWVLRDPLDENVYEDFIRIGNTIKVGMNAEKLFQATFLGVVDINSELTLDTDIWMHLACTWEPGVGVTFYQNGVSVGSVEVTGNPRDYQNNYISIGGDQTGDSRFQGRMDRMRLHKGILTVDQFDLGVTSPKEPLADTILSYDFNEVGAPYASKGSVKAIVDCGADVLSIASKPLWVSGPTGDSYDYALSINQTDSVRFGNAYANFNTDGVDFGDKADASFSMEAWIKDIAVSANRQVFFQLLGNKAGTCPRISFSISADREVFFTTMGIADFNTGIKIPADTKWHNIAVAYNAPAGIVCVYIDGKYAGAKAYTGGVNFAAQSTDLNGCIGRELAGYLPTTGTVDRIRLWKGVVGAADVDYPAGAPEPPYYYEDVNYQEDSDKGSVTAGPKGTLTIKGSGTGLGGDADEFYYVYNQLPDCDFDVSVKVENFTSGLDRAKAGLMIREGDAEGKQAGDARYYAVQVSSKDNITETKYGTSWRTAAGYYSFYEKSSENVEFATWLRIVRVDDLFYSFYSKDGSAWTLLTIEDTEEWAEGALGADKPLYVGTWVSEGDYTGNVAEAVFSDLELDLGLVETEIIEQPVSATVTEGSIAGFEALAMGSGITYQWYRDGLLIPGCVFPVLGTTSATKDDAGEYYVEVIQGENVLKSNVVTLTVEENKEPGFVQAWVYDDPNPGSVEAVEDALEGYRAADLVINLKEYLELPVDRADNYGAAIVGLITPEETGSYYFYVASGDQSELYLSSDATPLNLSVDPIAFVDGSVPSRTYDVEPSQKSVAIDLVAGESYYFELFYSEGTDEDNLSVAWATPAMGDVLPTTPIEAKFISPYTDNPIPKGYVPVVTEQPVSVENIYPNNGEVELSLKATGSEPLTAEWYKNGKATGLKGMSISLTRSSDNAGQWTAKVSNTVGSVFSDTAVISFRMPASDYEAVVANLSPWAYWRLGEAADETEAAELVNGRNAIYGAGSVKGMPGAIAGDPDTAVAFTGAAKSNTELYSTIVAPDMGLVDLTEATLVCWVKRTGDQVDYTPIMMNRTADGVYTGLNFIHGDQLAYSWGSQETAWKFDSGLKLPNEEWCFTAVVVTPEGAALYLGQTDGWMKVAGNEEAHYPASITSVFTLGGQDNAGSDRLFKGSLDEPMVFDYALSAEEIQSIFNAGTVPSNVGLRHRYSFNNAVEDSVGNADGSIFGNAKVANGCLSLDGAGDTGSLTDGSFAALPGDIMYYGSYTIETWARATAGNPWWGRLFDFGNCALTENGRIASGTEYTMLAWTAGVQSVKYKGAEAQISRALPAAGDGVFHHITYTYDAATQLGSLYIDGALAGSLVQPGDPTTFEGGMPNMWIGKSNWPDPYFMGDYEEFRIWKGAISEQQVKADYVAGPDAIGVVEAPESIEFVTSDYSLKGEVHAMEVYAVYPTLGKVNVTSQATVESSDSAVVEVVGSNYKGISKGTVTLTASYDKFDAEQTVAVASESYVLMHKYNFFDGMTDTVGDADGTIYGGAKIEGGILSLNGEGDRASLTDGSFAALPANTIAEWPSFTVETWVRATADKGDWMRVYDFGSSVLADGKISTGKDYTMLTWKCNTGAMRSGVRLNGDERMVDGSAMPIGDGIFHQVVYAYDSGTQTGSIYVDGQLVNSGAQAFNPTQLGDMPNMWLGKAQFTDPYFAGDYQEFRLYRGALSAEQVASDYVEGPDPAPVPDSFDGDVNYTGEFKGSTVWDPSTGTTTVNGCGADVWGTDDQFHYSAMLVEEGDFDVSVKIDSFTSAVDWSKAGLMVRESDFLGNQLGNARHFTMQVQAKDVSSNTSFWSSWRDTVGGAVSDSTAASSGTITYPCWQRIVRCGTQFFGFYSTDGENWTLLSTVDTAGWTGGALGSEMPLYVGLWVTSHDVSRNDAVAVFSDLTIAEGYVEAMIIKQPVSVEAVEGSLAGMSAIAIGTDTQFAWLKNGMKLSDSNKLSIGTIYANKSVEGEYQLAVYQGNEVLLSDKATLKVVECPTPNTVQAWFYDSPNPGSLGAVKQAFAGLRGADTIVYLTDYLEIPVDRSDYYGTVIVGLITPQETGTYYFYVASDDDSNFYLSTDETPANLSADPIAKVASWTGSRVYNSESEPAQKSAAIELVAGKSYYFQAFHNEGSGGDNFSVAWATPSMGDVVPTTPIEAKFISQYKGPAQLPTINYSVSKDGLTLAWTEGTLQSAPTAQGPWTSVEATSPITVPMADKALYYRLVK